MFSNTPEVQDEVGSGKVIYEDISMPIMTALIYYIYFGEVTINSCDKEEFLKSAKKVGMIGNKIMQHEENQISGSCATVKLNNMCVPSLSRRSSNSEALNEDETGESKSLFDTNSEDIISIIGDNKNRVEDHTDDEQIHDKNVDEYHQSIDNSTIEDQDSLSSRRSVLSNDEVQVYNDQKCIDIESEDLLQMPMEYDDGNDDQHENLIDTKSDIVFEVENNKDSINIVSQENIIEFTVSEDNEDEQDGEHHNILESIKGPPSFRCGSCTKSFNSKSNYKRHQLIHTGEKRTYKCLYCDKKFKRKEHMRKHENTHTGLKPFSCTLCDKKFNQNTFLTNHMRTHTGEKPYQCSVCLSRFTNLSASKLHMMTHTGEKPHQCAVCLSRFTFKSALKKHMRTHTGEKPYQCPDFPTHPPCLHTN